MKDCGSHDFELFRISRGEWAPLLATRLHVLGCPACRSRVTELRNVSGMLERTLSTSTVRQPFRRLSVPIAASIIVGGVFAFGSLAHQTGLIGQPGAAPARNHSSSQAGCDKEETPMATDKMSINGKCDTPKSKDLRREKRRRAPIDGNSIAR